MRVAVTGATGFVGRHTVQALRREGHVVRAVVRSEVAGQGLGEDVEITPIGSIDGETAWSAALEGVDAVVHLAARVHVFSDPSTDPLATFRLVNVAGTARLARCAARAGVRRFVFVSSIKVNGEETHGVPVSEASAPQPQDAYGVSKWEGERVLGDLAAETGMELVVLRPPLVFGPGGRANFIRLLRAVDRGVPLPFGAVENRRSLIYVGNLASAITRAVDHPRAAGKTFLVADAPSMSSGEIVRQLARALERPARLLAVPPWLVWQAGRLFRREAELQRLFGSLEIDSTRIRSELDWAPPFTLEQGFAETARWWRAGGAHAPR